MNNLSKLILTLAVLLISGASNFVKAEKKYSDLSLGAAEGNATWNSGTSTFSWTASSYAYMVVPGGAFQGDLSEYNTIGLEVSDLVNEFRVDILANGKTFTGKSITTNGIITLNILNDFNVQWQPTKITTEDLKTVTAVRINTNSGSGSAVIKKFYISKPMTLLFNDEGVAEVDFTDLIATGCFSFDEETGVLTNNYSSENSSGKLSFNLPATGIDFSNFNALTVTRSGDDIVNNSFIKDATNNIENGFWASKYGMNFTTGDGTKFNTATNVNQVEWAANNTVGSMTITSIKITANVITCTLPGEPVTLNTLEYHQFPLGNSATAAWNVNTSTDTYYGSGSSDANYYVDLTGYEELRIYRDNETGFRAFFINSGGTGTNNYTNTSSNVSWNATDKCYVIDLTKVETYNGKVYLNTIKSEAYQVYNIVKNITVYKTPVNAPNFYLSGKGLLTPSAATALANENATYIDATGITGATALSTANPNCLIVASAGMVTNEQNVIVEGTCANLVLTDGYTFKAPQNFTATNASYKTTINTAGTLCLPFTARIPDGVKAYQLTYSAGEDKAGYDEVVDMIPTNAPVLTNGSGSATFTFRGDSEYGAEIEATDGVYTYGALTGVFETTYAPKDCFVLQNQTDADGLGFYKVAEDNTIAVKPFRAYLTAAGSSSSRLAIDFLNDPSGITATTVNNGLKTNEIYNLNGQRVANPAKGLFIVNGKKVIIK